MRITPKRVARALKRRLRLAPAAVPAPARERVVVRELVLPADELQEPLAISQLDCTSLLGRYALPPLERMAPPERAELVDSLLSIQRMRNLGINPQDLEFPELRLKRIYNGVCAALQDLTAPTRRSATFEGQTSSQLNAFLQQHEGCDVHVNTRLLLLDQTILVPANTTIDGHGARVVAKSTRVDKAVLLDGVHDVQIANLEFAGGCGYAVYVKHSERFAIESCQITANDYKAICVMGENHDFAIRDNRIHHTGDGSIFLNGDVSRGIIEGNAIQHIGGSGNFSGGIVLSSLELVDINTAYNPWQQWYMPELLECPHDLVIRRNNIVGCAANGMYSHAGYCNYVVENAFDGCNKEGMCLDFGTCGTYVARNVVKGNGGRYGMTNIELENEYVLQFGRLADGSSAAKVPGISLDNACYNILYQNVVEANYGSGIKIVRSGARNVFLCNQVTDNNVGENDTFHFFAIELGTDRRPDYEPGEVHELDFAPCFENIIARNVISGDHYSGVFLGPDAYINDVFDNVIMDARNGIELVSKKLNPQGNNRIQ
ncbi:MAG: right-handed parallel beta-helix repeat-containing protein [Coriobacteriales bacterium]|nr:right-handed parallel beta-helix repeat-containing protein [Coriobacteriales bacterium]